MDVAESIAAKTFLNETGDIDEKQEDSINRSLVVPNDYKEKKTRPSAKTVATVEEAKALIDGQEVVIIISFKDTESAATKVNLADADGLSDRQEVVIVDFFKDAESADTGSLDETVFDIITEYAGIAEYEEESDDVVSLFKKIDKDHNNLESDITEESVP